MEEKREKRRNMMMKNNSSSISNSNSNSNETASLERSLQNCSLNNNNNNNNTLSSSSSSSLTVATSSSDDNYIDLNSHLSLPYHWDQCLDLKTGEVYYVNWSTGKKMKEDPRTTRTGYNGDYYSEDEDEDEDDDDSEDEGERESDLESHESSSCSSKPRSRVDKRRQDKEDLREEQVLVVAGCKSCFMYYMLPKHLQQCPKCCANLLHFPPDTRSFP